jgi:uncharacterized membrane protein/peptidoglycan/xylan/chitin deacetylase (PgdA/CDA1 family)
MSGIPSRAHAAAGGAFVSAALLSLVYPLAAAIPLALFVLACLAAPFFPGWAFFVPTTTHGPRTRRAVAITFDDGPDPRTLPALLALLARETVHATFFLVGRRAAAHPTLVRDIVEAGHDVGNHSQTHDPFLMLRSCRRLEADIGECQGVLARAGVTSLVFRPPAGITNPRLLGALRSLRLACVTFSCRPLDFGNRRLGGLKRRVLDRARPGDIVVLHDRLPPDVPVAPWLEEVAGILAGLREKGLRVAPLPELVGFPVMRTHPPTPGDAPSPVPLAPPGQATGHVHAPQAIVNGIPGAARALFFGAFPLLVLGGVAIVGARGTALLLLATLGVARLGSRSTASDPHPLTGLWLTGAALLALAAVLDDTRFMLAYPSVVNAVLLATFALSLRRGPPLVERLARLVTPDLLPAEVRYCRTVTVVWCAFFALNGSAATALALWAPRSWWAVYCGAVSYLLVGTLFAVEYLIRKRRFGRYGRGPVDRFLARVLGHEAASS